MLRVNVRGGTAAGRRIVKERSRWFGNCRPYYENPTDYSLVGKRCVHPGTRYSCPDCGARRP